MNLQQNKKFKYSVDDIFTLFCKSYQKPTDMDMKSKNLRNKHMFRYTSGIGRILLKSHLKFPSIQSSSNVVQTNNQNVGEAQI